MESERRKPSWVDRLLACQVTFFVTAINVGTFAIAASGSEMKSGEFTRRTLVDFGASYRLLAEGKYWIQGEPWTLVSAMFLHVGWLHLLWNTWVLFSWCAGLERLIGSFRFLVAYLTTGIAAFAIGLIGYALMGRDVVTAGASGPGFGVVAMVLVVLYRQSGHWDVFVRSPVVRNILLNVALWTLIGLTVPSVNMNHWAHLGGFLFGIPAGFLATMSRRPESRALRIAGRAAYLAALGAVVVIATFLLPRTV